MAPASRSAPSSWAAAATVPAQYAVAANPNAVSFLASFDEETVLVGYRKAHLWVEARGSDDMDLFVLIQKLDSFGTLWSSSPRRTTARWCTMSPITARQS
jgi:X-Pro dipeptidyl-peptidase C-terminal non-catalytic domain